MDGRFSWRRAAFFLRVAASVAALLAMEGAALSQQPGSLSLVVELPGAGPDGRDLESALRRIIGDEPLRVVDRKKGVIETNARGYDLLSADASVTTVRPLDERALAAAPARQSTKQAKSLVEWTIRLRTVPAGGTPAVPGGVATRHSQFSG